MTTAPIGVGIIGVHPDKGWAATAHVPALRHSPQYHLVAVSNSSPDIADRAAQMSGSKYAFSSTDELVSHPEVDLVVISVKVTKHEELVAKAIAAGKAVLCEWPLAVNLDAAVRLKKLADAKGVATSIGLQTRAAPPFAYARDLIRQGYLGEVLSATMIGSGIVWGNAMSEGFAYTLDQKNGAAMLNVPFAHSLDALLHTLDTKLIRASAMLATRRKTIRIEESGIDVPMNVADQIVLAGELANGAAVATHFRGGLSRATNFHVEINGSKGDILLTSPVGYVGVGGFMLRGAQNDEALHELNVPQNYGGDRFVEGPAQSVALSYERLASDMILGTTLSPTFKDAVELHRILQALEHSQGRLVSFE